MWEAIKNNPLLKTIAIAILGVLGFGFAFNIMFGGSGGEMGQEMSGGSLDSSLSYILAVLIKVLLITIVITAIVVVVKYMRRYLGINNQNDGGNNIKLVDYIKADPILKTVTLVAAGMLLLGILSVVFSSVFGLNRPYIMPQGYYYGAGLTGIVIFLVRFLMTISVLGLAIGVVALILQNKSNYSFDLVKYLKRDQVSSVSCEKCGFGIRPDWQCCPKCGQEFINNTTAKAD